MHGRQLLLFFAEDPVMLPRIFVLALVSMFALSGPARAENEGVDYLDQAIQARLTANDQPSLRQLGNIIALAQQAIDAGLDEANGAFARQLLASTLYQRGEAVSGAIFNNPDERWPQWRQMALLDLDKAVEQVPELAAAHLLIARLHALPDGDAKRLRAAVDAAVEHSDDDPESLAKALTMRSMLQTEPEKRLADLDRAHELMPDDAAILRARGAVHLALEKAEEALADFDAALAIDPDNVETHEARGLTLAVLGRLDESKAAYSRAAELAPDKTTPFTQRGRVNLLAGDMAGAIGDATAALKVDPKNVSALVLRAQARLEQDDYDGALEDINQALKLRPDLTPSLRLRAIIYAMQEKLDEAAADLEKLREQMPDDLQTLFQLAYVYSAQKKSRQAISVYDAAIKIDPDNWMLRRGRGDAYLNIGEHAKAVSDFNKVLELEPDDSHTLNNLAWVLATSPDAEVRDGARAVELAEKACELTEYEQAHIISTLAAGYAEMGNFEKAIEWARRAVEAADEDVRQNVINELLSYESGKAWRERFTEEEPAATSDDDQPTDDEKKAAKPAADKPQPAAGEQGAGDKAKSADKPSAPK